MVKRNTKEVSEVGGTVFPCIYCGGVVGLNKNYYY
jgi:hypothetical protein